MSRHIESGIDHVQLPKTHSKSTEYPKKQRKVILEVEIKVLNINDSNYQSIPSRSDELESEEMDIDDDESLSDSDGTTNRRRRGYGLRDLTNKLPYHQRLIGPDPLIRSAASDYTIKRITSGFKSDDLFPKFSERSLGSSSSISIQAPQIIKERPSHSDESNTALRNPYQPRIQLPDMLDFQQLRIKLHSQIDGIAERLRI